MDCTVIIPIGPGHNELAQAALQSAMLAFEQPGPFESLYVVMGDDTQGTRGRSTTRNRMVSGKRTNGTDVMGGEEWMGMILTGDDPAGAFGSEWLFFLDADDLMCNHALMRGIRLPDGRSVRSAFEVMTPYVEDYDCIWGSIYEVAMDGTVSRRKQVDRITTYSAFVKTPAALGCQMGHFVRRSAFLGFNEDMDVCEDIDLYLRAWKQLRCIKQEEPLFLNRRGAHTWMQAEQPEGRKIHTGRDWSIQAEKMLKAARKEL